VQQTGNVILVSDAIYCSENVGPPLRVPGFSTDEKGFCRTVDLVRELVDRYQAKIFYGHDLEQFNSLIKMDEGYYQ
jgi:N-acyl homoserine lactone hydrolase